MLVDELLKKSIISYDEIQGIYNEETEKYREVYQWLIFNNFDSHDYEKLIAHNIPVIESDYETWVGIYFILKSLGSLYIYPDLINALFDLDISCEELTS